MKKTTIRAFSDSHVASFQAAIASIQDSTVSETPIAKNDKLGSKISDNELNLLPFVLANVNKIENFLPRDFDIEGAKALLNAFQQEQQQLDDLNPIFNHLSSSTTVKRVDLKEVYRALYEAANKTGKKNPAMSFIYDKMHTIYSRSTPSAEKKAEKAAKTVQV